MNPSLLVTARSPDGARWFDGARICSAEGAVYPPALDFFRRWTFARFCPGGQLILAFETDQPWSEGGSYGFRLRGVQVIAPSTASARWEFVAVEYDIRNHDETFIPDDVVWHPRGVLAWLHDGSLYAQVLLAPRGEIGPTLSPERDSEAGPYYCFDAFGDWRSLELDADGQLLIARDAAGVERFDLVHRRRVRDDGEWQDLDVSEW